MSPLTQVLASSAGSTARRVLQLIATIGCAIAGGSAAAAIHMPLPWLLGSMLGVACISMAGRASRQPAPARKAAQIYIGSAIGLYFTPAVFAQMAGLAGWIVLGALVGLAMSVLAARWLQKLAKVDGPTAIYAVALGASAEMSVQAQRAGADAAVVASAHAVRIMMVTFGASFIVWATGAASVPSSVAVEALALHWAVALLAVATLVGWAFSRWHIPNAWVLGALVVSGACASQGLLVHMPDLGLLAAQLVIGWGLGQNMTPEFFTRAPRTLAAVAAVTVAILAVCVGAAMLIAMGAHLPVMTAFLSLAPGGMTEMGIISKTFGYGAPIVTSFHLTRILCTVFLTQPMAGWMLRSGWVRKTL
jgi:uncharacterized protein